MSWNAIQKAGLKSSNYHEYYKKQNHPKYTLFPKNDGKAYNSNSFAHGLFSAAGYDLSNPGHNLKVPGWKQKLPLNYFKETSLEKNQ